MFLIKIIRWIIGYVIIEVNGDFCERFLNLLSRKQINSWNIKRKAANKIELIISVRDFKNIKEVAKSSDCLVHIIEKVGLPSISFRYRKRKLFFIGAICFLLVLYFMSMFIWSVELVNADFIDEKVLLQSLEDEGLKPGIMPSKIDFTTIKNNILIKHKEISFISINIKGTKAYVELRQRVIPNDIVPKDIACNIVSNYDAVITKLEVLAGSSNIIVGEAVKKAQLIISGIVDSNVEGLRKVHAMGNVEGRVWIEKSATVKDYEMEKVYTNRKTQKNAVKILGFRINLFINSSIEYEKYDKIIKDRTLTITDKIVLPIEFLAAEFYEYKEQQKPISEDRAKEIAQKICDDRFNEEFFEQSVLKKDIIFSKVQDGYHMRIIYECILPLGKEEKIT